MSIFDRVQETAFRKTLSVMGFFCSWTPSNGGETVTGKVHLREPNKKELLSNVQFFPEEGYMEYYEGDFPNLKAMVDNGRNKEVVVISGNQFGVLQVLRDFDGRTYKAHLKRL